MKVAALAGPVVLGLVLIIAPTASVASTAPGAAISTTTGPQLHPGGRDVLILLDTSGSMGDRVSGQVKIQTARSAILSQVQELPTGSRVGLMTYPVLSGPPINGCPAASPPVGLGDGAGWSVDPAQGVGRALAQMSAPEGSTPTGEALLQAAAFLTRNNLTDVTIVLISDGESNCGKDACEAAKDVRSRGITAAIDTVGFDIASTGRDELQCIAKAGGGSYVDVHDAARLKTALEDQLGSGMSITVSAPTIPVSRAGGTFQVTATVRADRGVVRDVAVALMDTDPKAPAHTTIARVRVGNLGNFGSPGSGYARTVTWFVAPAPDPATLSSTFTVTASSVDTGPVSATFQVRYTDAVAGGAGLAPALRDVKNVLVLGDSYSSGEGAGGGDRPYFAEGSYPPGNGTVAAQSMQCHRTKNQYASWLWAPGQVGILACSGATTYNLSGTGQHGEDSQLAQLIARLKNGYRPDLILMSIGGNDVRFPDIVQSCADKTLADPVVAGTGFSAPGCWAVPGTAGYRATQVLVDAVPDEISASYDDIRSAYTTAGISDVPPLMVLAYPEIFPARTSECSPKWIAQNTLLGQYIPAFDTLQAKLDRNVGLGVTKINAKYRNRAGGDAALFVDAVKAAIPAEHSICADDPWFVPITVANSVAGSPERVHPTIAGQQAMAAAINQWISATAPKLVATRAGAAPNDWRSFAFDSVITSSTIMLSFSDQLRYLRSSTGVDFGTQTFTIDNAQPNSTAEVFIKSRTLPLGQVQFDGEGHGTLHVLLKPSDVPPGDHVLYIRGFDAKGTPTVLRVPLHFANPIPIWLWAVMLLGVICVLLAMWLAWMRRRPRRRGIG